MSLLDGTFVKGEIQIPGLQQLWDDHLGDRKRTLKEWAGALGSILLAVSLSQSYNRPILNLHAARIHNGNRIRQSG